MGVRLPLADLNAKPSYGAVSIDWDHPLAQGLVAAFLANELAGPLYDLVDPAYRMDVIGTARRGSSFGRWGLISDAVASGGRVTAPARLFLPVPISIFWRGVALGTPTDNAVLAGLSYASTDISPFVAYLLSYASGGGNGWQFQFNTAGSFQTLASFTLVTVGPLSLVGVASPIARRIYVNGAQASTGPAVANPTYGAGAVLTMGVHYVNDARNSNVLSDVQYIYNRELTPQDIAWLHREPYAILKPIRPRRRARLSAGVPSAAPALRLFRRGRR